MSISASFFSPHSRSAINSCHTVPGLISSAANSYFFRFTFDDVIFSTIITTFTRSELLKLEEYLKEMHDSRRPDAYGLWTEEEEQDGKVTKYNGIKCLVSPGKDATVIYSGTYIRKITA